MFLNWEGNNVEYDGNIEDRNLLLKLRSLSRGGKP